MFVLLLLRLPYLQYSISILFCQHMKKTNLYHKQYMCSRYTPKTDVENYRVMVDSYDE